MGWAVHTGDGCTAHVLAHKPNHTSIQQPLGTNKVPRDVEAPSLLHILVNTVSIWQVHPKLTRSLPSCSHCSQDTKPAAFMSLTHHSALQPLFLPGQLLILDPVKHPEPYLHPVIQGPLWENNTSCHPPLLPFYHLHISVLRLKTLRERSNSKTCVLSMTLYNLIESTLKKKGGGK